MNERNIWEKLVLFLSVVALFVSLTYFAYSFSNKGTSIDLENQIGELEKKKSDLVAKVEKVKGEIQQEEEKLEKSQQLFENKFGFSANSLDSISFEKEKQRFKKEQMDIILKMSSILEETAPNFLGTGYEEEKVEEFLSKYLELSSQSDLEKKKDSLYEELQINEVMPYITSQPLYRDLFINPPSTDREKQVLLAHVYSLSYPIYEILHGNRSKSNPEEMFLHYKILVDRLEQLDQQFGLRTNIDGLKNSREQMEFLFYKYREYDGVMAELQRLDPKKGQIHEDEKS